MLLQKPTFPICVILLLLILGLQSCKEKTDDRIQKKNNVAKIDRLINLGEKHFDKLEYDSSYYYFNEAKLTVDEKKEVTKTIYILSNLATIQQNQGDYTGSETTAMEAFPLLENSINPQSKWNIYTILGNTYLRTFDYETALYYYNKALNLKIKEQLKLIIKNNIAVVYMEMEDYHHAIKILLPLTLKKNIIDDPEEFSRINNNLGYSYNKIGNLKALDYLNQALKTRKQLKDDWGLISSYYNLSEYYKNNNLDLSINYALLAYQKATNANNADDRILCLKLLISNSSGNQLKKYTLNYIHINDSINKVRQKTKNQFAKMKYDSKKEKDENLELKAQKAENALQLEKQENRNLLLYFVVGIGSLISMFVTHYLVNKNKREKIKASYNTEIRIANKLHDELANDVFHTMAFAETQDLSTSLNKEILLSNLDTIYSRTRNISRENSAIETGSLFISHLKDMISGFNTKEVNVLINGMDTINWKIVEANKKIVVYRVLQELLVNMKKHSQCSLVAITFKKNKNKLQIDYTDNGLGATIKELNYKNGLQNVENRIKTINGSVTFDLKSNKGFKVNFIFPI